MSESKPNWLKIKIEYIHGEKSYRELAEEFGLSKTAVADKSKYENWIQEKESFRTEVERELYEKLKNKRVQTLTQAVYVSSFLLQKAKELLPILEARAAQNPKLILEMFEKGFKTLIEILGITPDYINEIRSKEFQPKATPKLTSKNPIQLIDENMDKLQILKKRFIDLKEEEIRLDLESKETEEIKLEIANNHN